MKTTFKQFLIEAPLHDYKTIGDFSKNSSFRDPRDRMIIQHPKSIERTRKKFGNTEFDFDFYFVNSPKANRHTEVGIVSPEWVKSNLGDDVYNAIEPNLNSDHIQVIFTNNKGAERVPLTAWMMGHRIAHAAARKMGARNNDMYLRVAKYFEKAFSEILSYYTKRNTSLDNNYYWSAAQRENSRKNQLAMLYFFYEVATFKSARDKNIRDYFEIFHELIAQYLTTGKIKFKKAPKCFGGGAFGKKQHLCTSDLEIVQDELNTIADTLTYYIDDMFGSLRNSVLVM